MHAMFENLMKELMDLWSGDFKVGMLEGPAVARLQDDFVISPTDQKAIDFEMAASNSTVPSALANRVRSVHNRSYWTAESYSHFLLFLGPIVMKDRLPPSYYSHFLRLSKLCRLLVQVEVKQAVIPDIKGELAE